MSEEQRNEETEVEAHKTGIHASDEPRDEAEVEGHASKVNRPGVLSANDESEDEVEGHVSKVNRPGALS
jgi:hypothetical protein